MDINIENKDKLKDAAPEKLINVSPVKYDLNISRICLHRVQNYNFRLIEKSHQA